MSAITAIPFGYGVPRPAHPATELLKRFIANAEYYLRIEGIPAPFLVLSPADRPPKPGHEFRHYEVNGRIYEGIYTNYDPVLGKSVEGKELDDSESVAPTALFAPPTVEEYYQYSLF